MNELDTEKIESLLKEEKYEEAKALLSAFFSRPMTREEKTELYLRYALLYLKVMNRIGKGYNERLREIKKNLEEVATFESKAKDRLNLAEVRSSL